MAMSLDVRAMPTRHPIVEMRVGHIAEVLEGFEVPVDRRGIDLRMARADLARDLFRRGVMPRALKRVEHQTALHRHPLSLRADLVRHAHAADSAVIASVLQESLSRQLAITCRVWTSASLSCFSVWPRSDFATALTGTTSRRSPTSPARRARATPRRTCRPGRRCLLTDTSPPSFVATSTTTPRGGRG